MSELTVSTFLPVFVRAFFFQADDGIRHLTVTGVQTCALPISSPTRRLPPNRRHASGRLTWPARAWRVGLVPATLAVAALAALPAAVPRLLALVGRGLGVEVLDRKSVV